MLYIVVTLYGGSGGELLTSLSAFLISFAFAFGTPISQTVVSIMYIFIQKVLPRRFPEPVTCDD